jgi:hypothetical protein
VTRNWLSRKNVVLTPFLSNVPAVAYACCSLCLLLLFQVVGDPIQFLPCLFQFVTLHYPWIPSSICVLHAEIKKISFLCCALWANVAGKFVLLLPLWHMLLNRIGIEIYVFWRACWYHWSNSRLDIASLGVKSEAKLYMRKSLPGTTEWYKLL